MEASHLYKKKVMEKKKKMNTEQSCVIFYAIGSQGSLTPVSLGIIYSIGLMRGSPSKQIIEVDYFSTRPRPRASYLYIELD